MRLGRGLGAFVNSGLGGSSRFGLDVGFCGNWTLEISVKQPVRIYAGMPIGQLIYFPVDGEIEVRYNQKKNAKYSGQINRPVESMMWKNNF